MPAVKMKRMQNIILLKVQFFSFIVFLLLLFTLFYAKINKGYSRFA